MTNNYNMFVYHSKSQTGARSSNEDEHGVVINADGSNEKLHPINFYGVYDGHGGSEVSKYIRPKLEKYFTDKRCEMTVNDGNGCNEVIVDIFDLLQDKVKKEIKKSDYCGSTVNIAIQYPKNGVFNQLKVMNIGDSRTVLCNKYNIAVPLTKDHKPNEREERKRITDLKGEIELDSEKIYRINGLSVSRAMGDIECGPHVSHIPEIFDYELATKDGEIQDKFLVLACDGLWDVLTSQEVVDFILEKMSHIKQLRTCDNCGENNIALMLGKHAIHEKKSEDNVSIVIIYFK